MRRENYGVAAERPALASRRPGSPEAWGRPLLATVAARRRARPPGCARNASSPERDALQEECGHRARPDKQDSAEARIENHDLRAIADADRPCAHEAEDESQGAVGHEEAGDVVSLQRRLPRCVNARRSTGRRALAGCPEPGCVGGRTTPWARSSTAESPRRDRANMPILPGAGGSLRA